MAPDQQGPDRPGPPPAAAPRYAWWRRLWAARAEGRRRRRAAHALYAGVVGQARHPRFYRDWGVPDTPEGRFEVIALHAFLVLRRLRGLGEAGRALGQEVFDVMFADLDRGLRELGVGDLSVGKHVKRYARSFYGRIAGLERALGARAAGDDRGGAAAEGVTVEDVLSRNLYAGGGRAPPPRDAAEVVALAAYLRAQDRHLAAQAGQDLLAGLVGFLPPGEAEAAGEVAGGGPAGAEHLEPARGPPM